MLNARIFVKTLSVLLCLIGAAFDPQLCLAAAPCSLEQLDALSSDLKLAFNKTRFVKSIPHGPQIGIGAKSYQPTYDDGLSWVKDQLRDTKAAFDQAAGTPGMNLAAQRLSTAQIGYANWMRLRGGAAIRIGNIKAGYEDLNAAGDMFVENSKNMSISEAAREDARWNARDAYLQAGQVGKAMETLTSRNLSGSDYWAIAEHEVGTKSGIRTTNTTLPRYNPVVDEYNASLRNYMTQLALKRSNDLFLAQLYKKAMADSYYTTKAKALAAEYDRAAEDDLRQLEAFIRKMKDEKRFDAL